MKINYLIKRGFLYSFYSILIFVLYSVFIVVMFNWIDPPTTAFIQKKSTNGLLASLQDYKMVWKSIDNISPYFPLAVISSEDQAFFDHNGFDFNQIQKALDEIERGKRFRGASTITQQTAKNLFLWADQSYLRKAFEAYYTVLIELLWSKKRILEVYVNTCELGKNIYGVEVASQNFFNKSSERLTPAEAALLATVLPRPSVRNAARPSQYMISRKESIIKQMNNIGGKEFLKKKL